MNETHSLDSINADYKAMSTPNNFVVLTTQRSGSTWLMSMLNNVPGLSVQGELFLPRKRSEEKRWDSEFAIPRYVEAKSGSQFRPFSVFQYLNDLYHSNTGVGFKLMYSQVRKYPEIVLYLMRHRIQVVHLIRKNHLDVMISGLIKSALGKAHVLKGQPKPDIKIEIDTDRLLKRMKQLDKKHVVFRSLLRRIGLPHHEVCYEDLLKDEQKFPPILEFLGAKSPEAMPESHLVKIRKKGHADTIINYDSVRSTLEGTRFFQLLDDVDGSTNTEVNRETVAPCDAANH